LIRSYDPDGLHANAGSICRLHVEDWDSLVEKNEKKLAMWKGKSLSIAGRTTMIDST